MIHARESVPRGIDGGREGVFLRGEQRGEMREREGGERKRERGGVEESLRDGGRECGGKEEGASLSVAARTSLPSAASFSRRMGDEPPGVRRSVAYYAHLHAIHTYTHARVHDRKLGQIHA